jgi:chromo domain-containing protein 1
MTERTVARQSRLEDDAISITSTQPSEHPEDFEFKVDRILAERLTDRKKYLIRWLNYPVERSTWEPRKNILDPAIVDLWKKRKMRETSGIDPPFDLAGFNDQLNKLAEEKAQRHRQRKAKRRRLGLPVSPSDSDRSDDNDSSVDAMGVNDKPEDDTGSRTSREKKNATPTKMSKKPFEVLVTGGGSSSDIDANARVRRQKQERQDSAAGASVALARPVLGNLQEVPTVPSPVFIMDTFD